MAGPLAGLKVVEFAGIGPAPLAGQMLADQGAEVIVVVRKSGKADPSDINNRSKRSVAINLKSEAGRNAALRLIARCDVLIEAFRPGVMEKLGLGPVECHEVNRGLVYGRMTGWGQEGPLAQTAGHDINYLAVSGALNAIGILNEPPVPPLNLVADYGGGTMFLLFGVLSALYEKGRSGQGQVVDAAMVDGVPAMMGLLHSMLAKGQWQGSRQSNLLDGGAPFYRCYQTKDDKFIAVGPLEPQFFAVLAKGAELPEEDLQGQYDTANWPEMHRRFSEIFRSKSRDEWLETFRGSDACVAPVLGFDEVLEHEHNRARGTFISKDGILQAAPAPRFDRTPAGPVDAPPAPGESTEAVLRELGYDKNEIAALRTEGVLT
jgi:alpha-methylacyl-CoA racemase